MNAHRYPVWASLARDHLAIMASSVSSEQAFSSAGITSSKRRNRLKGDVVEVLQFLKCLIHRDLIFCADTSASLGVNSKIMMIFSQKVVISWVLTQSSLLCWMTCGWQKMMMQQPKARVVLQPHK